MPEMQEEVDERQLLGQHGTGVHQVPHQRLPSQAETSGETRWVGRVGPKQRTSTAPV